MMILLPRTLDICSVYSWRDPGIPASMMASLAPGAVPELAHTAAPLLEGLAQTPAILPHTWVPCPLVPSPPHPPQMVRVATTFRWEGDGVLPLIVGSEKKQLFTSSPLSSTDTIWPDPSMRMVLSLPPPAPDEALDDAGLLKNGGAAKLLGADDVSVSMFSLKHVCVFSI